MKPIDIAVNCGYNVNSTSDDVSEAVIKTEQHGGFMVQMKYLIFLVTVFYKLMLHWSPGLDLYSEDPDMNYIHSPLQTSLTESLNSLHTPEV